jgi:hypothetical protein
MRQIRFAAIAFVGLVVAIASSFIDPGTFFHRTLSFTLCSVLGLTSNLCYANLARNSGDRAVAALPLTEQTQNTAPALDFSPYFQSTRPEFDGSDPTTKAYLVLDSAIGLLPSQFWKFCLIRYQPRFTADTAGTAYWITR